MPRLSVQHIIESRSDRGLELAYNTHCYPFITTPRPTRYTRSDFKKLNNLLFLLRENFTGDVPPYDPRRVIIRDNLACYQHFGCSLNSLANSLTRVITFVRQNFPQDSASTNENELVPTIVLTPLTQRINTQNGYIRSTVVSMIIDFRNCNDLISAIRDASTNLYTPQRNRTISNFGRGMPRRNMPTPQITLDASTVDIDIMAIRLDETREAELNNTYQRNLSQLLRSAEREPRLYEVELSSGTVSSYISNALSTFENNRFNVDANTRRVMLNGAAKLLTNALGIISNHYDRSTFPDNTLDITNNTVDWRRGVVQTAGNGKFNVGFRIGRNKVEEWLVVGNRGPNRNRDRMGREIREKIRILNTIFECFGVSITTTKIRLEDGDFARIFVLNNIPNYGSRYQEGISPLAIPTETVSEEIPNFFRDPLAGMDRGISSIFNFLLGRPQEETRQEEISEIAVLAPTNLPESETQLQIPSLDIPGERFIVSEVIRLETEIASLADEFELFRNEPVVRQIWAEQP